MKVLLVLLLVVFANGQNQEESNNRFQQWPPQQLADHEQDGGEFSPSNRRPWGPRPEEGDMGPPPHGGMEPPPHGRMEPPPHGGMEPPPHGGMEPSAHGGPQPHGPRPRPGPHGHHLPPIFRNLSREAIMEFEKIIRNENATKAEMKQQIDDWAKAQGSEVQKAVEEMETKRKEMEDEKKQKIPQLMQNITDFISKMDQIKSNTGITRREEMEQIMELMKSYPREVAKTAKDVEKAAMEASRPPRPEGEFPEGEFPPPPGPREGEFGGFGGQGGFPRQQQSGFHGGFPEGEGGYGEGEFRMPQQWESGGSSWRTFAPPPPSDNGQQHGQYFPYGESSDSYRQRSGGFRPWFDDASNGEPQ